MVKIAYGDQDGEHMVYNNKMPSSLIKLEEGQGLRQDKNGTMCVHQEYKG